MLLLAAWVGLVPAACSTRTVREEPAPTREVVVDDEPDGILGETFDLVGAILLFPFRVIGATFDAIF